MNRTILLQTFIKNVVQCLDQKLQITFLYLFGFLEIYLFFLPNLVGGESIYIPSIVEKVFKFFDKVLRFGWFPSKSIFIYYFFIRFLIKTTLIKVSKFIKYNIFIIFLTILLSYLCLDYINTLTILTKNLNLSYQANLISLSLIFFLLFYFYLFVIIGNYITIPFFQVIPDTAAIYAKIIL